MRIRPTSVHTVVFSTTIALATAIAFFATTIALSTTIALLAATKLASKFTEFAKLPKSEFAAAEFTTEQSELAAAELTTTELKVELLAEVINSTLISVFRTTRRAPAKQRPSILVCRNLTCTTILV